MRRTRAFAASLLIMAVFLVGLGAGSSWAEVRGVTKDSIRIGLNFPLTKFLADAGRQSVAATKAWVQHVNDSGGIHGRKLELVIDDSQFNPSVSLGILKKQLTNDNIFLHIVWGTPPAGVLIKPAMKEKLPLLIWGGAKPFYIPPKKYVFAIMTPYELQSATCLTYVHDILKDKDAKVAVFWRNDDYGRTALIGARAAAEHYGYEIVAEPSYMMGQAIDFTAEIMKIKRSGAEYVLLGSSVNDVAAFLREAKNQGLKAKVFGALSPCSERRIIEQAGPAAEGYMAVHTAPLFNQTELLGVQKVMRISKKYVDESMLQQESFYYMFSFTPLMLMTDALKMAGKNLTPDKFVQAMHSIEDENYGGLGPDVTFSQEKHYSSDACYLGRVNMETKNFDPITDYMAPPKEIINRVLYDK